MKANYFIGLLLFVINSSYSQHNENFMLDSSFSKNGKVITILNKKVYSSSTINTALVQNDGKVMVAGYITYTNNYTSDFLLARYLPNGSKDFSFGDSGVVITNVDGNLDFLYDAKILSNNKIITVGEAHGQFVLIRYKNNGSLDENFGLNGRINLPDPAYSIAIDKNDNIFLAGELGRKPLKFTVRRYNINGKADSSFGTQGLASVNIGTKQLSENPKISLDNNQNIIVGGTSAVGYGSDNFVIIRFKPDGLIDSSFNNQGWCFADFNNEQNSLSAITIQSDNKIVCGGSSEISQNFTLCRITANGNIDSSFGDNGFVSTDFNYNQNYNPYDYVTGLAIQNDKKIVAAGTSLNNNLEGLFAVSRYNKNGTPDKSFGFGGKLKTGFQNGKSRAGSIILQNDGKIIVAGNSSSDINSNGAEGGDIALVRYRIEKAVLNEIIALQNNSDKTLAYSAK